MSTLFTNICELFQRDLASANSSYYIAVSKFTSWPIESTPPVRDGTYVQGDFDFRQEMILGKKVAASDTAFLIARNTWTEGNVYSQYDDSDSTLFDSAFFVINSNSDVFKCIWNALGAPSTEEPVSKTTDFFELADGYRWKYMYTLSSANNTKFGTSLYIPVDSNTAVVSASVNGTLDSVIVKDGGTGFNKFATGQIQSSSGNTAMFKLDASNSGVNGYYAGMMIYISSGTGDGKTSRILQHVGNTSGIYIVTSNAMNLDFTSSYTIYPEIVIDGNGTGARAYCTVNTVSKSIASVNIIDNGSGYTSARVYANTGVSTNENLRAITSPVSGHGSDAVSELGCVKFAVVTTIDGAEEGAIPIELSYREYAMLKDPLYANNSLYSEPLFNSTTYLSINVVSSNTGFYVGETVTGVTSGAVATLGYANSSIIMGTLYSGEFANGELVVTSNSNISASISGINSSQINVYSGEILFYDTASRIDRANNSLEDVGFILTNLSGK